MNEEFKLLKSIAILAIGITIIGGVCGIAALSFKPTFLGFEREAFKESHQYVETKESQLLQWINEYNDLEVEILKYQADNEDGHYTIVITGLQSQQKSLATRIEIEAQRLPKDTLPDSVEEFLNIH